MKASFALPGIFRPVQINGRWLIDGAIAPQAGNDHPTSIPTGVFRTADGHINIAAAGQAIWERCARVLGHPEWITAVRGVGFRLEPPP